MRGRKRKAIKPIRKRGGHDKETASQIRQAKQAFKRGLEIRLAQIKRTAENRKKTVQSAVKAFKPKRQDRGTIVFIGGKGGRIKRASNRKGYAVYVTRTGKKRVIKQFDRKSKKVEKTPVPRKLTSLDISRATSKKAKKQFYQTYLNPAVRGIIKKTKGGLSDRGTQFAGKIATTKFYENSDSVAILAKQLVKAVNSKKSKRDFLVSIGIHVREANGRLHFISLERRFSRQDNQAAEFEDVKVFFGREIYAFLARELSNRGLVLEGSARHIARLKGNRGKPRSQWRKDGFLWQGHDEKDVQITGLEYRFDHLTLSNGK